MTKQEYIKLTYAIGCIMNGDPESDDHDPRYGLWDDGMGILDDLRRQYIKERKITATYRQRAPCRHCGCVVGHMGNCQSLNRGDSAESVEARTK